MWIFFSRWGPYHCSTTAIPVSGLESGALRTKERKKERKKVEHSNIVLLLVPFGDILFILYINYFCPFVPVLKLESLSCVTD
jgi:hypothetical protein